MEEWKEVVIADYIDLITGFAFKSSDFLENQDSTSLPVIKIKNVANGDVNLDSVVYHKYDDSLSKYVLCNGDVLIAMTGNHPDALTQVVGGISRYKLNSKSLLNQRVGKIVVKEKANIDFVYYLFKDKETQNYLANQSSGSANQANISKTDILRLNIDIPELTEQRAIASVLSSLDDKIDLLHRQNATLEKMAGTLFRQWFVEEVQEDWEMGKILDLVEHSKSSIVPQKHQDTKFYHYSIPSFDNNREPIEESGNTIQSNKYIVPQYSILFSKLNPHKDKRVWLLQDEVKENSICSTEFQIVLPKDKKYLYFLYCWLSFSENYNEIASGVGGTSGSHQRIDPATIFDFQCPLVSKDYIEKYNSLAENMFQKIKTNKSQIRTLAQLREALLPKLMSGDVRVKMEGNKS